MENFRRGLDSERSPNTVITNISTHIPNKLKVTIVMKHAIVILIWKSKFYYYYYPHTAA